MQSDEIYDSIREYRRSTKGKDENASAGAETREDFSAETAPNQSQAGVIRDAVHSDRSPDPESRESEPHQHVLAALYAKTASCSRI